MDRHNFKNMLLNAKHQHRHLHKSPCVSYLKVSKYDKRFLLVGYKNGSVDIYAANDLKHLIYRSRMHKMGELGAVRAIHFETSMMKDNLSYLAVLHEPLHEYRQDN